ncbi:hypothetical protein [Microbacterium sp. NPDC076895]|uniref:hypothetical protein n=1 Tax=Microbacterium sp. NPDC076895 TaxID=3154957 RepID=UPI00343F3E9E
MLFDEPGSWSPRGRDGTRRDWGLIALVCGVALAVGASLAAANTVRTQPPDRGADPRVSVIETP